MNTGGWALCAVGCQFKEGWAEHRGRRHRPPQVPVQRTSCHDLHARRAAAPVAGAPPHPRPPPAHLCRRCVPTPRWWLSTPGCASSSSWPWGWTPPSSAPSTSLVESEPCLASTISRLAQRQLRARGRAGPSSSRTLYSIPVALALLFLLAALLISSCLASQLSSR